MLGEEPIAHVGLAHLGHVLQAVEADERPGFLLDAGEATKAVDLVIAKHCRDHQLARFLQRGNRLVADVADERGFGAKPEEAVDIVEGEAAQDEPLGFELHGSAASWQPAPGFATRNITRSRLRLAPSGSVESLR